MKIISLTALLYLLSSSISAQENTVITGGEASGSGGSSSYSLGQVAYTSADGTNGSVAQGVQQPYEISIIDGIEEAFGITINLSVYPNPTNDIIYLDIKEYESQKLLYNLYDSQGKILQSEKLNDVKTAINMEDLDHANYLLLVYDNEKLIKSFKVIKN